MNSRDREPGERSCLLNKQPLMGGYIDQLEGDRSNEATDRQLAGRVPSEPMENDRHGIAPAVDHRHCGDDDIESYTTEEWIKDVGNTLKAFIGLNFMFVSFAFSLAGLLRGTLGLLFILIVTERCCLQLIRVKDRMPNLNDPHAHITYAEVADFALGIHAKRAVNVFLVLTQFGYCVGYLIFLSHTVHDVLKSTMPIWIFVLIPLPILMALALLRSIRSLANFSNLANFSLLAGFLAVTTYILVHFKWNPTNPSILSYPLFFGQMTAALEGIALVLPIQMSVKHKEYYPGVLRLALFIMGSVLFIVGILGMVTFGDETRSIILLNVEGSGIADLVKMVLCLGILFTYPLQLVPVLQALEGWIKGVRLEEARFSAHDLGGSAFEAQDEGSGRVVEGYEDEWEEEDLPRPTDSLENKPLFVHDLRSILGRLLIVLGTAVVAMLAGKSFGLFQSLVGSLGAASLAYSFPSLLHVTIFGREMSRIARIRDYAVFVFGVVGAIMGTGLSIYEMATGHGESETLD
mmetsp:Transcript_12815/g.26007  ORF Transcript_12815/g.26007 Transcript_12815/m.26007 type:complete len:519 (+) Transcript_12815:103-1659(+)